MRVGFNIPVIGQGADGGASRLSGSWIARDRLRGTSIAN